MRRTTTAILVIALMVAIGCQKRISPDDPLCIKWVKARPTMEHVLIYLPQACEFVRDRPFFTKACGLIEDDEFSGRVESAIKILDDACNGGGDPDEAITALELVLRLLQAGLLSSTDMSGAMSDEAAQLHRNIQAAYAVLD